MNGKKGTRIEHLLLNLRRKYRNHMIVFIIFFILLTYAIVYISGNLNTPYTHIMYIPILIAGISLGTKWGIVIGIFGGLFFGPVLNFTVLENKDTFSWLFETIIFTLVGCFSGFVTDSLLEYINININLFTFNQETKVPNVNSMLRLSHLTDSKVKSYTAVTVIINNSENIISILGQNIYSQLFKSIYDSIKAKLSYDTIIVQSDKNKLWICMNHKDLKEDVVSIVNKLEHFIIVSGIPLYVDYSVGGDVIADKSKILEISSFQKSDDLAMQALNHNINYLICDKDYPLFKYDINLISEFAYALKTDQTFLAFQPQIDIKTKEIIGLEALIRWNNQKKGIMLPDTFIPLIEETQIIHELTFWVLTNVLLKIKELENYGIKIPISVNISPKNLLYSHFYTRLKEMVNKYNVDPSLIELEITESAVMHNPNESFKLLEKLRNDNFRILLDDFGKGYSSLSHLIEFKVDVLKVDKYFINKMENDPNNSHIVNSIIKLAHNIGSKVIAEGIENKAMLERLAEFNCDYGQGYYISMPIHENEVIDWIKKYEKDTINCI